MYKKQFHSKIQDDSASLVLRFDRNLPANKSSTALWCVFPILIRGRCAGRRGCLGNSPIQVQDHSKLKKTPHHSQSSQLHVISPIQLEISHIREHQLTPKDENQTVGLSHKSSQATPNTMKMTPDQRRNFIQDHN